MRSIIFSALLMTLGGTGWAATLVELENGRAWIARAERVEEWTPEGLTRSWNGPAIPMAILRHHDLLIVTGAGAQLILIDIRTGTATTKSLQRPVSELVSTPRGVVLLEGMSGAMHLLAQQGELSKLAQAGADAAGARFHNESVYIYSRARRTVSRVLLRDGSSTTAPIGGAPSDLEVDDSGVYLTYPEQGEIEVLDPSDLTSRERFRIGSAPVDIALASTRNPADAGTFVVADPAAGAVIRDERSQSLTAAVLRGFLRGVLGAGLARAEALRPNGRPDRIRIGRSPWAQDSASGRIWRIDGRRIVEEGTAPPGAYDVNADGSAVWVDRASGDIRWYDPN